jgi:hypothetical protein
VYVCAFDMARQPPSEDGRSTLSMSADVKSGPNIPSELASSRMVEDEKQEQGVQDIPPDGGVTAWLQVFAGFLLVMNSR